MEVRFVPPDLRRLDELKCEAIALPFFTDVRPLRGALGLLDWRLCGQVSRLLLRGHASGAAEEAILIPARPRLTYDKLFLFGAGAASEFDDAVFEQVVERMLVTLDRARVRVSVFGLPGRSLDAISPERAMELYLERMGAHPEHDQVTLIEPPDAQRRMGPVVERAKRRERALSE
ncbi:MAG: leucyl aminopeptidase [Sandaracinaceae bacterium]|nr:MAG: leucyl aminopeptidase [Sandaracinaceae bacterium]